MSYKVKKKCRVCGKEYIPCSVCENDNTAFHWRSVACSKECGAIYLERVMKSRETNRTDEKNKAKNNTEGSQETEKTRTTYKRKREKKEENEQID